jgi:hypothetical protein
MNTDWTTGIRSPAEEKDFLSSLCVQTSSGAHPASYPMGTVGPFPRGKAQSGPGTDITLIYCRGQGWVGAIYSLLLSAWMACSGTDLLLLQHITCSPQFCKHVVTAWYRQMWWWFPGLIQELYTIHPIALHPKSCLGLLLLRFLNPTELDTR